MENTITTTRHTDTDALMIHKELHEKHAGEFITLNNKHYTIFLRGLVKAVNINGDVFIQQNRLETGILADRANKGDKITHIVPSDGSEWGRIINNKVEVLI
jgi:hypothetical protein